LIEVIPLVTLRRLPQAPKGLAGLFNYRGQPLPAVDLCELTLGHPAAERLSTRIIIVNYSDAAGASHLLGLIAEHATETLRKDPHEFLEHGLEVPNAPYLGSVLMDASGPIQWIQEQRLLPEPLRDRLFGPCALVS
jgi:chemotaxis-related protein WspB